MGLKRPDQLSGISTVKDDDIFIVQTGVANSQTTERKVVSVKRKDLGLLTTQEFNSVKETFETKSNAASLFYLKSNPSNFIPSDSTEELDLNLPSLYPRSNPSGFITINEAYPRTNPSGYISEGDFYPTNNPSGFISSTRLTVTEGFDPFVGTYSIKIDSTGLFGNSENNSSNHPIYLARGETYIFDVSQLTGDAAAKGLLIVNDLGSIEGIENSFPGLLIENNNNTEGKDIKITIPQDFPNEIFYKTNNFTINDATGSFKIFPEVGLTSSSSSFDDSHLYPRANPSGYITSGDLPAAGQEETQIKFYVDGTFESPYLKVNDPLDGTFSIVSGYTTDPNKNAQLPIYLNRGQKYKFTFLSDPLNVNAASFNTSFIITTETGSVSGYTQGLTINDLPWSETEATLAFDKNPIDMSFVVPQDAPSKLYYGLTQGTQKFIRSTGEFAILDASDLTFDDSHLYRAANPSGFVSDSKTGQLGNAINIKITQESSLTNFRIQDDQDYASTNPTGALLSLNRGQTYKFHVNTTDEFVIKDAISSADSDSFNHGVTSNIIKNGILTFKVPHDAPKKLYYQSLNVDEHTGIINIPSADPDDINYTVLDSRFYPKDGNPSGYLGSAETGQFLNQINVDYEGVGSPGYRINDGSYFNGSPVNPEIYLTRGQKYYFNVAANVALSAFYIKSVNSGTSSYTYDVGITGNGVDGINGGQLIFTVPYDAPETLYYVDADDASATGKINILKETSSLLPRDELLAVKSSIIPTISGEYSLGSASKAWKDLYLSTGTLHIGQQSISIIESGDRQWTKLSNALIINGPVSQNGSSGIDFANFVTRSETGVFLTSDDDTAYVTNSSTGNLITKSQTGNFLTTYQPFDDAHLVHKTDTGNLVTTNMTGASQILKLYELDLQTGTIKRLKCTEEFYFESSIATLGVRCSNDPECTIGGGFDDGIEINGNICHSNGHNVIQHGYLDAHSGVYTDGLVSGKAGAIFGTGNYNLAEFVDDEIEGTGITFCTSNLNFKNLETNLAITGTLGVNSQGRVYVTQGGGGDGAGEDFAWFMM